MGARIKCFLLEPTSLYQKTLRRYAYEDKRGDCPLPHGYHDNEVVIEEKCERLDPPCSGDREQDVPHNDPRWPAACVCSVYAFLPDDEWQINYHPLYKRADTGELVTLKNAPAGAIWNCSWYPESCYKPDRRYIMCRTPGGDWGIDGACSNCDRKGQKHDCWVRQGNLTTDANGILDIHVSKDGPNTCSAGAGSIIAGSYHAFLHHGFLDEC